MNVTYNGLLPELTYQRPALELQTWLNFQVDAISLGFAYERRKVLIAAKS